MRLCRMTNKGSAMNIKQKIASASDTLTELVAPDCHGMNFFDIDHSLQSLILIYLPDDLRTHLVPHFRRLGELAGNELDDWSRLADRHRPVLHHRSARGAWNDYIEFHPAYRAMESLAFSDFGLACMIHKPGVLGWHTPISHTAKFVFQYLFGQSEFSQLCPISATETTATMIGLYGDEAVKAKFLDRMLSQDMNKILKGAQFMTERTGGSDVSNIELEARWEDGVWRLYGEKWFCSCADGDVALLLARPKGAPAGNKGLALFAMPRHLDDGGRNRYRIARLKDKLGSCSMASGEIEFNGAIAYALGEAGAKENHGLKMMMTQVSLSRLSHGARATAMMRRCLNEAMVVARNRSAFGERIIDKPLMRRQLMKLMVPTEQSLSLTLYLGNQIDKAEAGDKRAERITRLLTPVHKYRASRDNIRVATGAMEVRGGNGYIEDWVNPKLVRDAHLGVLWEGTSNINALDVTTRAVVKVGAHRDVGEELQDRLSDATDLPDQYKGRLSSTVRRAIELADEVGRSNNQVMARKASSALYHSATAALMAAEGAQLGGSGGDARRVLLSRMVLDHRLSPLDPLLISDGKAEAHMTDLLLSDGPVSLEMAREALNI
jgi:acyl-CoA dehydrogenase